MIGGHEARLLRRQLKKLAQKYWDVARALHAASDKDDAVIAEAYRLIEDAGAATFQDGGGE